MDISPHDREICLRVLKQIARDPSVIDDDDHMKALVAKIHTRGKKGQRRAARETRLAADRALQAETRMVQHARERAAASSPLPALPASTNDSTKSSTNAATDAPPIAAPDATPGTLSRTALCYVCKQPYAELDFFYHSLCPRCATFNRDKRAARADLSGRTALLTGGRVKIGFEIARRLLRDGARVLLTTRFPRDAAQRFAAEPDFTQWRDRLQLFALDLRDLGAVEGFADELLRSEASLDILIHNAAQTVKRPLAFYRHLLGEDAALPLPEAALQLVSTPIANASLLERHPKYPGALEVPGLDEHFPPARLDADGQQVDARPHNSWRLRLHEVSTLELVEVQLVNAVAPFVLNAKLKPLLLRSPFARRFIVHVSAMEGQFARRNKTQFHPHTNMAKAALNMMTRTSAQDFARDGIFMNSVDTGWITDENPLERATRAREARGFYTPLDHVDGAARVLDPILSGLGEAEPLWGHFLKDYAPHPW